MKTIKPYKYFPHTDEDIEVMLNKIGINDIDDLFNDIPSAIKVNEPNIDTSLSEIELRDKINNISQKNKVLQCYRGCGSYDVYTPSIVDTICSRQEFLTSYTPYQAEISQGTLQYIFEYQSVICELTGMDVSNASMYDGATSTAEAVMMACNYTRRSKVIISNTLNPNYLSVIKTYAKYKNYELIYLDVKDFKTDISKLDTLLSNEIACVVCSYPNYYGYIENYSFIEKLHNLKIQFVLCCDISSLALLKTPRELGADIVCGDAQTLGISKSFGGPYIGYMACTEPLMRKLPGRIVGMTTDVNGKRGYVLTLQAREQHIRREKANSNICSNQSLMALMVTVYSAVMGKRGLIETQEKCYDNSHYLKERLLNTKYFVDPVIDNNNAFLKEFVLKTSLDIDKINDTLENKGYLGGYNLQNGLVLFCVTETKTKKDIDIFINALLSIIESRGL